MMTKDQEREVLKKIAKLIESTGEDSYIKAAFDGCIELAEENITNDFVSSYKDISERAHTAELTAKAVQQDQAEVIKRLEQEIKDLEQLNDNQRQLIKDYESRLREAHQNTAEAIKKDAAKFDEIQNLSKEIVTLKAKLYDLMTA